MIIIVLVITIIACGAESTESAKKQSDNSVKDSVLKIESGFVIKKTKDTVIIVEENKADKLELTTPESIALNEKIVIKKTVVIAQDWITVMANFAKRESDALKQEDEDDDSDDDSNRIKRTPQLADENQVPEI